MFKKFVVLLLIILAIYASFDALLPDKISTNDTEITSFSAERALTHVKAISLQPHYVGSDEHEVVKNYIVTQLRSLGLQPEIQEGYTISKWGNLSKAKNILTRIKGSEDGKSLLLLSHYDSNPHSSPGASDAGSGVATILEGIRAYLAEGKTPRNDIIILISDAEELGLNGADLFVNNHEWAKDVGLVLNFEARGSGGPNYMLIETNGGNSKLMDAFVKANVDFPVANSLAYSIYKMLPNDTDLTVFKRDGNIDGFNFAFIDDHYDYHSALDTYERLNKNSLEHQGSYLMPLLYYFSEANLNNLKSESDNIYFNIPLFKIIQYPFSWIFPLLILSIIAFIALIVYGKRLNKLEDKEIYKGFGAFFSSLVLCGLVGFLGWKLLLFFYPDYQEMLHGFTYNGGTYIWTFSLLSLGICMYVYHKVYKTLNSASLLVAPLFFWLVICSIVSVKLKGASFFIIPVIFGLLSLLVLIKRHKPRIVLLTLLGLPVLMIMSPFIKMFPVGLGLKILFVSCVLVVLIFGLLISVFGSFKHKKRWSYLVFFIAIITFIKAHYKSDFSSERPKPNSLVYMLDSDKDEARWATYDLNLDKWTKNFLGEDPDEINENNQITFGSKYATGFTFSRNTNVKSIEPPKVEIYNDTLSQDKRYFNLHVIPQRKVNRIEVFSKDSNNFYSIKLNGIEAHHNENNDFVFSNRKNGRLFTYYISDGEHLSMEISAPKDQKTELTIYESSFDLLEHEQFTIPERSKDMIPKPFVLNDAIILKKTIIIE